MMNQLAHRPATGPVGRVQLTVREARDRIAQVSRTRGQMIDGRLSLGRGEHTLAIHLADRKPEIRLGGRGSRHRCLEGSGRGAMPSPSYADGGVAREADASAAIVRY